MRHVRLLAVIVVSMAVGHAWAQSIDGDAIFEGAVEAGDSAAVVLPAPGGGDMVILGTESRYVTRAWRDHGGKMQCGCTREDADTAERVRMGIR